MNCAFIVPKELRRRYISRRSEDVDTLSRALKDKNYLEFNRIGHQLKGNARSYGYEELSALGQDIEAAGKCADGKKAEKAVLSLSAWIKRVMKDSD